VGGITNVSNAFAGIGNPAVVVFDWETDQPVRTHLGKEAINGVAWGLRWHPGGYWIGLSGGGAGGLLYFWKYEEVNEFFKFKLPASGRDLDLHPDGRQLAIACADSHMRIFLIDKKA